MAQSMGDQSSGSNPKDNVKILQARLTLMMCYRKDVAVSASKASLKGIWTDGAPDKPDLDDVLQEGHGLVNGRFSVKGISDRHLVRQDSLQAAGQGLSLLL